MTEHPLKTHRLNAGMTQAFLAEKSGIDRTIIARIETGQHKGNVDTLRRLADSLGVTIDELVPRG